MSLRCNGAKPKHKNGKVLNTKFLILKQVLKNQQHYSSHK